MPKPSFSSLLQSDNPKGLEEFVKNNTLSVDNIKEATIFLAKKLDEQKHPKKHIEVLLPFVHDQTAWGTDNMASYLVYAACVENDLNLLEKLLTYPHVYKKPDGTPKKGIEGWSGYLESHIYGKGNDEEAPSVAIAKRLAEFFKDESGLGLLRCIQIRNHQLFDVVLPHSNIEACNYFVYYEALISQDQYFIDKLSPLCNKMQTLFGINYRFPFELNDEEQEKMNTLVLPSLRQDILNNPKTPCDFLYALNENKNEQGFTHLFNQEKDSLTQQEKEHLLYLSLEHSSPQSLLVLSSFGDVPYSVFVKIATNEKLFVESLKKASLATKNDVLVWMCKDNALKMFPSQKAHQNAVFHLFESGACFYSSLSRMEKKSNTLGALLPNFVMGKHQKEQELLKNLFTKHQKLVLKKELASIKPKQQHPKKM